MAHIGDTRLYQYHQGKITKLSHDHSLIGYREEVGELTEEEAMHHPQRNVIGRDVGSKYMEMNTDLVEMETFKLKSNSLLLLCSDGLSDMITSAMMTEILSKDISLKDKTKELINKANSEGGNDNITVVLVQYTGESFEVPEVPIIETVKEDVEVKEYTDMQEINVQKETKDFFQIRVLLIINTILLILVLGLLCMFLYSSYNPVEINEIQPNNNISINQDTIQINVHVEKQDSLND